MEIISNNWSKARKLKIQGEKTRVTSDYPTATAYLGDKLYCAFIQPGAIHFAWTIDGKKWVDAPASIGNVNTEYAPALAVFKGKLYCAWNGGTKKGIFYASYDGDQNLGTTLQIPGSDKWGIGEAPALCAGGGRLYCASMEPGWSQSIRLVWTTDPSHSSNWAVENQGILKGIGTKLKPTIAWYNHKVYCAWNGYHNDGVYYASFNKEAWSEQHKINILVNNKSDQAPALATFNERLYCAQICPPGPGSFEETIKFVSMNKAGNWEYQLPVITGLKMTGIDLTAFGKDLSCSWLKKGKIPHYTCTIKTSTTYTPEMDWKETGNIPITCTWDKSNGPAMVAYKGRLYCAWFETGNNPCIHFVAGDGGGKWEEVGAVNTKETGRGPVMAVYNDKLYFAWNGDDKQGIFYSYYDGSHWGEVHPLNVGNTKSAAFCAPGLDVYKGELYCAWVDGQEIKYASTVDGKKWKMVDPPVATRAEQPPKLTTYGDLMYFSWKGPGAQSLRYSLIIPPIIDSDFANFLLNAFHITDYTMTFEGLSWFDGIHNTIKEQPPALTSAFNGLFCAFQCLIDGQPYMNISSSLNCQKLKPETLIPLMKGKATPDTAAENNGAPALAYFNGRLYCAWNDYEKNAVSYASSPVSESFEAGIKATPTTGELKVDDFVDFPAKSVPGNVGVCLSGGGSRAAMAGMGQIRGLKYLKTKDGKSLLEQVKALSTVSGGSWFGGCYTYLNEQGITDDDFLNKYAADRSKFVLRDPGNGLPMCYILNEFPKGNFGRCIASDALYFPNLAASMFDLYKKNTVPLGMTWQTTIGKGFLEPYNLYSGGNSGPKSYFSYDEKSLKKEILDHNPSLARETVHLYPLPEGGKRLRRPFWICNFSLITNNEKTGDTFRYLVPVQSTPFYTGVFGNPTGVVDNNGNKVGGGGVGSFAFSSIPKAIHLNNALAGMFQHRPLSLADIMGLSSSFYVALLVGSEEYQFPAKPEDSAKSMPTAKEMPTAAAAPTEGDHGWDELSEMAYQLLVKLDLVKPLESLGIPDIHRLLNLIIGNFKDKYPNLAVNFESLELLGKSAIPFGILLGIGLLCQGIVDLFTGHVDKVEDFWNNIDRYLKVAFSEVIPLVFQLVPRYNYWSPELTPSEDWKFQPSEFGDGGILENTGINNMLTYTDIDNILCFINSGGMKQHKDISRPPQPAFTPIPLPPLYNKVTPLVKPGEIQTIVEIDSELPPLFGYQCFDKTIPGYRLYKGDRNANKMYKNNQVFPSEKFEELLNGLIDATGQDCRQNSANFKQALTTVENTWFGVKGGRSVTVLWSCLNYAQSWVDGLSSKVRDKVGEIKDFPNYFIGFTQDTPTEINLMSQFTSWCVAGDQNKAPFIEMFE